MARIPKVKLRAIPVFPSNVIGATGIRIFKTKGIWTVTLDVSNLHISGVAEADTTTTYAISWGGVTTDNPDGTFLLVPFAGFQAVSADLTSLSELGTIGLVARIGDADYATRTLTAGAGLGVTNGGGIAGNPTISVTDAELLALAGVTSAADRLFYFTGSGTGSLATFTTFGRSLVDDADAATARATLGVVIGTNVQAWDADLDAVAALSTTGLIARTGAGTSAVRTITAPAAGITVSNGDGVSGNPTLVLANDLAALEGLSSTGIAVRSATDTWVQRTLTGTSAEITVTNGNGVSGNPTASLPSALTFTGKTVTGGTFASPAAITGLPDPSSAQDAATKAYVDSVAAGLDVKPSVICATTANITLSGEQTLDGILTSASRVLVKNQSTASQNGIYVSGAGAWSRALDMDAWAEVPGSFVFVEQGTLYADTAWVSTANAGGTIGSTSIPWSQFAGAGTYTNGTGLSLTGTQFAIDSTVATLSGSQTFTNKGVNLANNTVTGTTAQFNTALSDGDFATLAGSESLTNKNLAGAGNTFPTFNQNTSGSAATLTTPRAIDGQNFDGSTAITVIAPGTHAATSKATPVDADELPLVDSAASNVLKKLTWANLKATLKTYFDAIYAPIASPTFTGTVTAPKYIATNSSTSGTHFDTSGAAAIGPLATGASAAIAPTGGTKPFMLFLTETQSTGWAALFMLNSASDGVLGFTTNANIVAGVNVASRISIGWDGTQHRIYNNIGLSCTFHVTLFGNS